MRCERCGFPKDDDNYCCCAEPDAPPSGWTVATINVDIEIPIPKGTMESRVHDYVHGQVKKMLDAHFESGEIYDYYLGDIDA